jgi:hypothetical protein
MQPLLVPTIGTVIRDTQLDTLCRVIYIDQTVRWTWLFRLGSNGWPYPAPCVELENAIAGLESLYSLGATDPWYTTYFSDADVSATDKRQIANWNLICPLVSGDNELKLLYPHMRAKLIAARLLEVSSTRQTISALLKRYWERGMTYTALRPDYRLCGAPGKARNLGAKKVGAPRRDGSVGINATELVRRHLHIAADFYLAAKRPSLEHAINHIVRLFYSRKVTNPDGKTTLKVTTDAIPTARQLQNYLQTQYPLSVRRKRIIGQHNWDLSERAITGRADGDVIGPGDRFQIDATIADCYLVSQFDRRRIVGPPVIYFVVDVFSRMIVGLYVGFEGPSWAGAMMALVNVVTPKVEFCRGYEIDIEPWQWSCHHWPRKIMGDRGELLSTKAGQNVIRSKLRRGAEQISKR